MRKSLVICFLSCTLPSLMSEAMVSKDKSCEITKSEDGTFRITQASQTLPDAGRLSLTSVIEYRNTLLKEGRCSEPTLIPECQVARAQNGFFDVSFGDWSPGVYAISGLKGAIATRDRMIENGLCRLPQKLKTCRAIVRNDGGLDIALGSELKISSSEAKAAKGDYTPEIIKNMISRMIEANVCEAPKSLPPCSLAKAADGFYDIQVNGRTIPSADRNSQPTAQNLMEKLIDTGVCQDIDQPSVDGVQISNSTSSTGSSR